MRNSYKEPCYVCWHNKQDDVPEVKIRSKLLKIFKSKKWKKNTKDTKLRPPFTLPKLKIIKDDRQISSGLQYDWKSSEFSPDFLDIHRALVRRTKSCPMEKPPTVWFNLHDFQESLCLALRYYLCFFNTLLSTRVLIHSLVRIKFLLELKQSGPFKTGWRCVKEMQIIGDSDKLTFQNKL